MLYFAITSNSFRKSSIDELNKISRFKILDEFINSMVIESEEVDFVGKLIRNGPIFIYNMVFLQEGAVKITEEDYLEILYQKLHLALPKEGSLKIECVDLNCKTSYSAKEIEIFMGERLEAEGRAVDLKSPDHLAYVIMVNGHCYSGVSEFGRLWKKFIEPERHYHTNTKYPISRSELKLIQAFDEFKVRQGAIAIDLGAAPGGWSNCLLRNKYKVIAIDNGLLEYEKFKSNNIKVRVSESLPISTPDIKINDLIHVKSNAREISDLGEGIKADLILNDMNMEPEASVSILLNFLRNLNPGAGLILTIKCINRKAELHIRKAEKALSGKFKIISIRCLPANRQELTLYASYLGDGKSAEIQK